MFTINGNPTLIPASAFKTVPGTSGAFKSALVYLSTTAVPISSYNLVQNSGDVFGMAVLSGNSTTGTAYAYLSEFNSYPFVDAGADNSICANVTLPLNGVVGGGSVTGSWSGTGYGSFSSGVNSLVNTYVPSPLDTLVSPVKLILTSSGPCPVKRDTLTLIVNPSPIVNASADQSVCGNNANVNLNGSVNGGAHTGRWSTLGSGTFAPNDSTLNAVYMPTAAEISGGSLFLTLTSTNNGNCLSVNDNMQINFVAPPFANFNLANVCLNATNSFTDFSLPGYGSIIDWEWDFGDLTSSTIQNPTHLYGIAGTYNVELITTTNAGCKDTVVKPVTVYALPVANFTYDAICSGANIVIDFQDSSTVSGDALNYWFYDFGGMGSATTQNPSQLFLGSGNFIITHIVGTTHGCLNTIVQTISISPRPSAGFYYNTDNGLNVGATFDFIDTSQNAVNFTWEFGDGNTSGLQNPSNTYFANGTYVVTEYASDAFGCVDSASVTIHINTVSNEITTLIPNAISPNGDGKNDVWKLPFIKLLYPQATVEIYNRWGQQIFYSSGYEFPWDGTYNGTQVTQGTYYYIINLNVPQEPNPFKGTILVLKQK
jgi:gliding motility-associated-like protein